MIERAGYIPGIDPDDIEWHSLHFGHRDGGSDSGIEVTVPMLTAAQMQALTNRVRTASARHLRNLSVTQIVDIIDRAMARLLDRDDPYRQKAEMLLPLISGYDQEMVRLGLTEYFKTFRKTELRKFLAEDFANPQILDSLQPATKGGFTQAFGPRLLVHIWAGNVPALPLWSLVCGLLVKAGNIGKLPSAEPFFAGWFAHLLAEVEPRLAECFAIVWWQGGDEACEAQVLGAADCVAAYGGNDALTAIRARVPITTRYLPYSHKISFAVIAREALNTHNASTTAYRAAYDMVRYDQHGCYSPQTIYVERGGRVAPREFARMVAHELDNFERKFPRRILNLNDATSVAAWRHAEETKAMMQPDREILSDSAGAWTLVYANAAEALAPSGLNRTVRVVAVEHIDQVLTQVAPFSALLQTVGLAAAPERIFEFTAELGEVGVTRVCALGAMSAPEAGWHHDGRFNLADLVTITELERSAEQAAEDYAAYRD